MSAAIQPSSVVDKTEAARSKAAPMGLVWGAMLLAMVLWASAFPGIRAGLRYLAPVDLVALRLWGAAVLTAGYAAATRMRMPERRDWPRLLVAGLLGMTLYQLSLSLGETKVPAGTASLMVNIAPVFGAILAWAVLKEAMRPAGWLGIAVSFAGATIIALGQGTGANGLHVSWQVGLVIASAVCGTLYSILQKPMLARYSGVQFTCYAIWIGAALMTPALPHLIGRTMPRMPAQAWGAALYLAAVPTVFAFALWAYALSKVPYSRAASAAYLIPVFSVVISYFWLREVPRAQSLVGGAVVLAGVIVVNTWGRVHAPAAPVESQNEAEADA